MPARRRERPWRLAVDVRGGPGVADIDAPPAGGPAPPAGESRGGIPPPRRRRGVPRALLWALGALVLGFGMGWALRDAGLQVSTVGPADGAHLGARETEELHFRVTGSRPSLMQTATLEYDGADVTADAFVGDGVITYRPRDLSDGAHTLTVTIDQPFVPWPVRRSWTFTVDRTRPRVEITGPARPAVRGAPAVLTGRVDEPARVTVDGREVAVAADGSFTHTFPEPPAQAVTVRATDRAGNTRGIRTTVPVVARRPLEPVRAVHMTAISWDTDSLREPVLRMLEQGRINAIQLDLKDESGVLGYDSDIPFARRIGAVKPSYRLEEAVREIHDRGGRVIGRVVAFSDPVLAEWAWDNGRREMVVQTPDGRPYAGYGGFANFSHPDVRRYNIDVAVEGAEAGMDEILYDYIRRPDGPIETMRFPGLRGGAQRSVVSFLAEAREALEPSGAFLGASLFGIAAFRPEEIAQDVGRIARNVDYVAPMVYPSHWGPGVYGVADPESEPGPIVRRSVEHFMQLAEGSGARIVPWLQDFSLRVPYGPREVRAQIEAAEAAGAPEWIAWDPNVTYSTAGYPVVE